MKSLVVFFICLLSSAGTADDLHVLRKNYQSIHLKEEALLSILKVVQTTEIDKGTAKAYQAAALLCSAKYKVSPFSAYQAFAQGSKRLDAVIAEYPRNAEARYLRYTIQTKCPAFLGYSSQLKEDRIFLITLLPALKKQDPELYVLVQSFMVQHDKTARQLLATLNSN